MAEPQISSPLEILCNECTLESLDTYHEFIQEMVNMSLSDQSNKFTVIYGSSPMLFQVSNFGGNHLILKPAVCESYAYVVHKSCCVLDDPSIEYRPHQPVLLYASPSSAHKEVNSQESPQDSVSLHISSRTYSIIHKEDYGLPLKESVIIKTDERGVPKFHLSSSKFSELYNNTNSTQLLLFQFPAIPVDLGNISKIESIADQADDASDDSDVAGLWYDSQKESIKAVQILPAFLYGQWPQAAYSWGSRTRKWPTNQIVQKVVKSDVYLVPIQPRHHKHRENVQESDDKVVDDSLWYFDFTQAEELLINALDHQTKQTYFLLQSVFLEAPELKELLRPVFLWSVEEHGPDLNAHMSRDEKLLNILLKFETFLSDRFIPHYFIPEINLLSDSNMDIEKMVIGICHVKGILKDVIHSAFGLETLYDLMRDAHFNQESLDEITNAIMYSIKTTLLSLAGKNTQLLSIQLYQKLHRCNNVSQSLSLHQSTLSALHDAMQNSHNPQLLTMLEDFTRSSMASMYFVHGLQSYFAKEKQEFFRKSENEFELVKSCDNVVTKLRKSLYLLKKRQHQAVINLLESEFLKQVEEITASGNEGRPRFPLSVDLDVISFSDAIMLSASHSLNTQDLLVMTMEGQGFPSTLHKNLRLAQYQYLGYTQYPVALLDPAIICGYYLALAYIGLKRMDKAMEIVQIVEDESLKDESDFNEKRGCLYFNILASVYHKAGNMEQAKYLLGRSVNIVHNPINPARFMLLLLNTKKTRDIVVGGITVAVATAVTAAAVHFFFTKR